MSRDEVLEYIGRLLTIATTRPITEPERFIFEQLLSNFRAAVLAEAMGKKGRYFVLSEDDIGRMMKQ
jgi:hypothetical protein